MRVRIINPLSNFNGCTGEVVETLTFNDPPHTSVHVRLDGEFSKFGVLAFTLGRSAELIEEAEEIEE